MKQRVKRLAAIYCELTGLFPSTRLAVPKKLDNKIFIEAKSSSNNDGAFYLSRNEWNTALEKKEAYFIHVWIKDRTIPVNIDFERLYSKKYRIDDAENAEWTNINIKP